MPRPIEPIAATRRRPGRRRSTPSAGFGTQAAPVADDRRQLHDPVRRGGRHPDRAVVHARRRRRSRPRSTAAPSRATRTPAITDISTKLARARPGAPASLFVIGSIAFAMLVPILAGFIAFAIADRPGLVPGIVGGLLAVAIGAGFLGGLVGGLLAGGRDAAILTRVQVPRALRRRSCRSSSSRWCPRSSSGPVMIVVLGKPIASAQRSLTDWLNSLSGSNAILLGAAARRDDGLRHGRPGQQGRLHVRARQPAPAAT